MEVKSGILIESSLFPEPVKIEKVDHFGDYLRIVGVTINSNQHVDRIITKDDCAKLKEIDLGIPTFKDSRKLSEEVFERLKADSEIVEKISPNLILERYLGSKDYLELRQLYKTLLSTPGEPRISRDNFIKSIKNGVKDGHFGFGFVRDGGSECIKFREIPEIALQDYEAIIRKELCEREVKEESDTAVIIDTRRPIDTGIEITQRKPREEIPSYKEVSLSVKLRKGKFYEFYKYVLDLLENSFDETEVEIKIIAKKGEITKQVYEDNIKETLTQIKAEIVEEKIEE